MAGGIPSLTILRVSRGWMRCSVQKIHRPLRFGVLCGFCFDYGRLNGGDQRIEVEGAVVPVSVDEERRCAVHSASNAAAEVGADAGFECSVFHRVSQFIFGEIEFFTESYEK